MHIEILRGSRPRTDIKIFGATDYHQSQVRRDAHRDHITGSDFLMDGGVTAAYWYGDLAPR